MLAKTVHRESLQTCDVHQEPCIEIIKINIISVTINYISLTAAQN